MIGKVNAPQPLVGDVIPRGEDGISPKVEVTPINGGHNVAITDIYGKHTFDVMDGKPGADGKEAIFVGNVYSTTYAEYEVAYAEGKACFAKQNVNQYPLVRMDASTGAMFSGYDHALKKMVYYTLSENNEWTYGTIPMNVKEYVDETSQHTHIPTAKAVYDALQNVDSVFVGDEDTTVAEYYEAYQAGKVCFIKRKSGPTDQYTWVAYYCTPSAAFFYHVSDDCRVEYGTLASDGSWSYKSVLPGTVKSVNGITPSPDGNVKITIPDSGQNGNGLSTTAANLLIEILRNGVYSTDQSENITALATALSVTEPDEPDVPEVTLTSISATYSGGDVAVGTAVTDLTGIAVTAIYSDGTSKTVTDYTLSGTIAEGSNTITVTYEGKTATFTVTGVAESVNTAVALGASWQHSNAKYAGYYSDGGETKIEPKNWTNAKNILSQEVFTEDTLLRITIATTAQSYISYRFASSLIEQGRKLTDADTEDLFYWCVDGDKGWSTSAFTLDYTVHAGYKLCILGSPSANVDIITVEKVVA
jgi:hypothetical protein